MPPTRTALISALIAVCLTGCGRAPELDATIPDGLRTADFPALVPIETLIDPLPGSLEQSEIELQKLQIRHENLRSRANRLNRPIVDEQTRARMRAGVAG
ncbi:hypothetical protein SAMN05216236_102194 [Sedimentitalea nanhaiensis]|uniref:Uncharacterized protein n=2 Tax=Sedimentitalea nanhaiensis TaxID=999627 RepID=A0A1I6YFX4_9RHOB|nr:hypothetical protein SAMN05216236_102194 [Sedimentitalea nanhaiensis]